MVHGRVIRPPVAGAMPVQVDESFDQGHSGRAGRAARRTSSAVVAEKEWDAVKAADKLKVEWSNAAPPFPETAALYDHIRKAPVRKREEGKADRQRRRGVPQRGARGRGRIRVAVPVACQHGTGVCAGRDQGRARRPAGPARRSPTSCATASPTCSACRPTRCARSGCPGPGAYGRNDARRRRDGRGGARARPPAARCACSTRATRAPAGTRRARPRSIARAPRSMRPAT